MEKMIQNNLSVKSHAFEMQFTSDHKLASNFRQIKFPSNK